MCTEDLHIKSIYILNDRRTKEIRKRRRRRRIITKQRNTYFWEFETYKTESCTMKIFSLTSIELEKKRIEQWLQGLLLSST